MLNPIRIAFLPALLLTALAVGGCAVNPVTGKNELMLLSTQDEINIGNQHYLSSQQAEGGQYTLDTALNEYVTAVGKRLSAVSDRALPYEFVVLNNSTPNAWALPGGKIALNRGLLVQLDNEAELAAVLGHEIVHAAAKHGAQAEQRSVLFGALLAATATASQQSSRYSKYADEIIGVAGAALQLTNQKYSRDDERESDYHGMKYMHAAGYDTAAAVTLQEKFVALSKSRNRGWLDGLFATHPPSAERVNNNRRALAEFPPDGELGHTRYRRRLAHLRARQPAYAQADRARQLLATDSKSALRAINDALTREPKEPMFHSIKGQILLRQERNSAALRAYDAAIARDPGGYYAHFLGRGIAHRNLGQYGAARRDLARSNHLLPTAEAAYNLGSIVLADGNRAYAKRLFRDASGAGGNFGNTARAAFVRLDLADQPARYVNVDILFAQRQVMITVQNSTAYALRNLAFDIEAKINEDTTSRRLSLQRLPAKAERILHSGIRYQDADAVEATAWVIRAETAAQE